MRDSLIKDWSASFAAGIVGAVTLTAVHQIAKKVTEDAPRMDVLGERAIARTVEAAGGVPPGQPSLYRLALAGDLLANSAYYSLIACGRDASMWTRAATLGIAAGIGALVLPQHLGLGNAPKSGRTSNQAMTLAWYMLGALATAVAGRQLKAATA